jgi:hypothetical protein
MRRVLVVALAVALAPTVASAEPAADVHHMHHVGFQLGGPTYFTPVYRFSPWRFVELEAGYVMPPHSAGGTAGLLIYPLRGPRYQLYLGSGGSVYADEGGVRYHAYGRLGVARVFKTDGEDHRIGVEIAVWRGQYWSQETMRTSPFLWPMIGVAWTIGL